MCSIQLPKSNFEYAHARRKTCWKGKNYKKIRVLGFLPDFFELLFQKVAQFFCKTLTFRCSTKI
jgi:hypothetical protein